MKRLRVYCCFVIVICLLSNPLKTLGQYYYYNNNYYDNDLVFELGGTVGLINAITDIGGQERFKNKKYLNEINWKNTRNQAGVYLGLYYQQIIGARIELMMGSVQGIDSLLEKGSPRFNRNLSYRSSIREVSLMVEFHPMFLRYYEESPPYFSPYIMAGIGWFSFNPQGNLNGQWIDLQPLRLEGQGFSEFPDRKPYKLNQPNICGGIGVKYELASTLNLRLEWVHRYLFTDYLDDVSKSYIDPKLFDKYLSPGNASMAKVLYKRGIKNNKNRGEDKNTDAYFTINLKLGLTLGRTRR